MACITAAGPAPNRPPHCVFAPTGVLLLSLFKPNRLILSRRSVIAATAGLTLGGVASNSARAQAELEDLPDAGPNLSQTAPAPAPDLKFFSAAGKPLSLANYRGSGLVVNIWATWCGPCVAELPSFAAIARSLAASKILVLPISVDFDGVKAVRPFYASRNITGLPILLDPDGAATDTLNADGIPVTIIINPRGELVGRLEGAANWNTPDTVALLRQLAGVRQDTGGFQPV
jgi:thiol-disulfide isomerase/thioredoxin